MQTTTHTGTATLRWAWKKDYAIKSLKGLQLEMIFCTAMGTITRQQEVRAKKKARRHLYILCHYKRIYDLYMNDTKNIDV